MIRLSLDASNVQREKIVFELMKPYIPGFSVEPMEVETSDEQPSVKRKADEASVPAAATAITLNDNETNEILISETKTKKTKKSKK